MKKRGTKGRQNCSNAACERSAPERASGNPRRIYTLPAAIAPSAGFTMCGFFTSIAPAMMGKVPGYDNRLLIGVKAAVTSTFFVVAYIAISVPVIGLGLMASVTSLKTAGITYAAVMGLPAALALVLLVRRGRAGVK